jgi:uncharacterized repeat protein (TIGR03803 family)
MHTPTNSDSGPSTAAEHARREETTGRGKFLKVANSQAYRVIRNWSGKACGVLLFWAATVLALSAQTFTTLVSFDGTDNGDTNAGLVQGLNGDFYGTTVFGGASDDGTVFKVTPGGTLTTLHVFGGADGSEPFSTPVLGTDGNLYGTTNYGGDSDDGTVFKVTPGGTFTTLHSFNGTDGINPQGGLVEGADGNFYGMTLFGAAGFGTVFKITPAGTFTTLHIFFDGADGGLPYDALIQGADGNFYGTTFTGGGADEGTVFKITAGGTLTTLHSFCLAGIPCPDGGNIVAGLVQGTDGSFYGAAGRGGNGSCIFGGYEGCGTIFKITASGTLTTLHLFNATDGASPVAALVEGTDGNFYGTTHGDGTDGLGTVFRITSSGTFATLHDFDGSDGGAPNAGALIQGTDGVFYGTTPTGGADGAGTVFSLSVGLGPFVETLPDIGKVGDGVKVLGTNLNGATSVTFNGLPAAFTVVSSSLIRTTVPAGATAGLVQVTLPGGTLVSNVVFRVQP